MLTVRDRLRIAAHAVVSERSVVRAYAGARGLTTTRERIHIAADELGLPRPPEPAEKAEAAR
jgi:hypothetical protein